MRAIGFSIVLLLVACTEPGNPGAGVCKEVRMIGPTQPFSPSILTLKQGECVEFVNIDQGVHDAVSVAGTPANLRFATRRLRAGERQKILFNLAGEVEYICTVDSHAQLGMRGTIRVQP